MGRHPLRQGCICTDLQKGIYPIAAKFISVSPLISCSFSSQGKNRLKGDCDKVGRRVRSAERDPALISLKRSHTFLLLLFYLRHVEDRHKDMKAVYEWNCADKVVWDKLRTWHRASGPDSPGKWMWPWPSKLRDQKYNDYTVHDQGYFEYSTCNE